MATMDEISRLRKELAKEEKARADGIARIKPQLRGRPLADLVRLKSYWEAERKKHRKLDEQTSQKRTEAAYWIEAIEIKLNTAGPTDEPLDPESMSVEMAARYLKISKSKLYKMTMEKEIPHYKVGRELAFNKCDLEEFRKNKRQTTSNELDEKAQAFVANRSLISRSKGASR